MLSLETSQLINESGDRSAVGMGRYKAHPITEQVPDGVHGTAIKSGTGDAISTIIKDSKIIWIINLTNGHIYSKNNKVSS